MPRVTLKSSTIFVSVGDETHVYRSVDDVPPKLRRQLEDSTNGINSATILIADRRGREEIVRAIRSLPGSARGRVTPSLREPRPTPRKPQPSWTSLQNCWPELLIPPVMGFLIWLLFSGR